MLIIVKKRVFCTMLYYISCYKAALIKKTCVPYISKFVVKIKTSLNEKCPKKLAQIKTRLRKIRSIRIIQTETRTDEKIIQIKICPKTKS